MFLRVSPPMNDTLFVTVWCLLRQKMGNREVILASWLSKAKYFKEASKMSKMV